MKIKKVGFTTFRLSFNNLEVLTDPLLMMEAGMKLNKNVADVVLITDRKHAGKENILKKDVTAKLETKNREELFTIASPGEFEIGGVLIRRPQNADYYILDEGTVRIVYMGSVSKTFGIDSIGDLGDVDVLILPVGDAEIFPSHDKIEKVIGKIDPTYIIPCGYSESGLSEKYSEIKDVDFFLKQFGYTHVTKDNKFSITSGSEPDNKVVEVVVLNA